MKTHLVLTCLAYAFFGFGIAVQQFGIKSGIRVDVVLTIFIVSVLFYAVIMLTSLQKLKKFLDSKEESSNKTA